MKTVTFKKWLPALSVAITLAWAGQATASTWSVAEPPQAEFNDIRIATSEGTWMSVDISPDGQWVVFDMLGDIYRMPASGGDAELLRSEERRVGKEGS